MSEVNKGIAIPAVSCLGASLFVFRDVLLSDRYYLIIVYQ
jgi:hypothetical protein